MWAKPTTRDHMEHTTNDSRERKANDHCSRERKAKWKKIREAKNARFGHFLCDFRTAPNLNFALALNNFRLSMLSNNSCTAKRFLRIHPLRDVLHWRDKSWWCPARMARFINRYKRTSNGWTKQANDGMVSLIFTPFSFFLLSNRIIISCH
jgi:hypothetical protein